MYKGECQCFFNEHFCHKKNTRTSKLEMMNNILQFSHPCFSTNRGCYHIKLIRKNTNVLLSSAHKVKVYSEQLMHLQTGGM